MNEQLDSQLSAMFDDELPQEECELLARRLSRDEALKARWRRYAVIGAAIRAERGVRLDANLAARVSSAISAEPSLSAEEARSRKVAGSSLVQRWWQPVAGTAVAAGVAALSVMWLRSQDPLGTETLIAQTPAPVDNTQISAQAEIPAVSEQIVSASPESYTTPAVNPRNAVPVAELANYVVAHSEYSSVLSRRNLLSALVASEAGTGAGVDQSEDAVDDPEADAEDAQ
jgi:sigma-E factor negative regulatory protein RseA